MLPRPPEQLDRYALVVAEDALGLDSLRAPRLKAFEPGAARMLEALFELERLARYDKHLDIGEIVSDAPRNASCEHDLFDDSWERSDDPLRERPQFACSSRGHGTNLTSLAAEPFPDP